MGLPSHASLEDAVRGCFGNSIRIESEMRAFGGDINDTEVLDLSDGQRVFVKMNTPGNIAFFDAEEEGLGAIAATGTIRTPKLLAKGTDRKRGVSFLMMELIEKGMPDKETWHDMGHEYAMMHLADTGEFVPGGRFGFARDNFIGASKQVNTPSDSWVDFYRSRRLEVQIRMAGNALAPYMKDVLRLLDRLGDILTEPERPSLLHGDMWGGNHLVDKNGQAVLIDPAAYVGHAEADMAMTEMFGSMPHDFYRGYHEMIPEDDGYRDRKDLYNLYHYLNHFNLFAGHYLQASVQIIRRYA
ncbi:MAG: fructosamine kinase family protein [Lachnospiraceae bacterium]|nr:fructosamine kinase family protein [Lachnospiraceae bacterium]